MKNIGIILMVIFLFLAVWQCVFEVKGIVIDGQIENVVNMQVYFDQVKIGKVSNVLVKVDMDINGQFKMEFLEGIEVGVY